MANSAKSGNILFLGNEFVLSDLVAAFNKANVSYVEPKAEFHKVELNHGLLPEDWKRSHKQPVVTIHEGKYIFLYRPEGFEVEFEDHTDQVPPHFKALGGFRAKFVTKYNFNRAKYVAAPAVDTRAPIYEDRRYDDRFANRPVIRTNPNQNGGGYYNNTRRFDERS